MSDAINKFLTEGLPLLSAIFYDEVSGKLTFAGVVLVLFTGCKLLRYMYLLCSRKAKEEEKK